MSHVVIFGAGSVGRGFVGQIFSEAGWGVTFVDTDPALVAALHRGSYVHATVSETGTRETLIGPVDALPASDTDAIAEAVAGADFLATSVGAANLRHIARHIARGLVLRVERGWRPVDILLAENLHDADAVASELIGAALGSRASLLAEVGLLRSSIGRMIPVPSAVQRAADVSWIAAEPYRELPFDISAARAPIPDVPDLVGRTDVPFAFFADRKLYLHNLGHALTAYLGALGGHAEIATAIDDPGIRPLVETTMTASAVALATEYGEPQATVESNRVDLLHRFSNHALHDSVERVGRDPQRKLAPGDRFLGALELTARYGLQAPVTVAVAVGADALLRELAPRHRGPRLAEVRGQVLNLAGESELPRFDAALAAIPDVEAIARLATRP